MSSTPTGTDCSSNPPAPADAAVAEAKTPAAPAAAPAAAAAAEASATITKPEKTTMMRQSIPILKGSVGLIIGKDGRSIQNIQKRAGCRIQINDRGHSQFCEEWAYAIIESDAVHKMNIAKQLLILNLMKYVEIRQKLDSAEVASGAGTTAVPSVESSTD